MVQPKPKEALESTPAVNKVQPRTTPVPQPIQINQPKSQPVVKSTVSGTNNVVKPPIQQQSQPVIPEEPEKKISMFNLLMHYSKENKALYDQQKAAKRLKMMHKNRHRLIKMLTETQVKSMVITAIKFQM